MVTGDQFGQIFQAYQRFSDNFGPIDFQYYTPYLDMGLPNTSKRFHKVVVWVDKIGNWDIKLDYWSAYRSSEGEKSTRIAPLFNGSSNLTALWDVAYWDEALWDDYNPSLIPITFNLDNDNGNGEGDCIRLRFRNNEADQPVLIYGYSVFWTEKGLSR
jgi:hypothetical protein